MEAGGRKSKAVRAPLVVSHELVGRTERAFFIENELPDGVESSQARLGKSIVPAGLDLERSELSIALNQAQT